MASSPCLVMCLASLFACSFADSVKTNEHHATFLLAMVDSSLHLANGLDYGG